MRVRPSQPAFQSGDMRQVLPVKSRVWWVVVCCSLAAVALFMTFEVLDLDGSHVCKRLLQPPIPSSVAWTEEVMRNGAFASHEALGHLQALDSLRPPSTGVTRCLGAMSATLARRLTTIRPRTSLYRASFHPPTPGDEPPHPTHRAI
jgi:hypothetical protein